MGTNKFNITGNEFVGKIIAFIVIFIIATYLVDIFIKLLEKIFHLIAFIPGSKYINNLAGGVIGFLEGALFLGLIIFIISHYVSAGNLFGLKDIMDASFVTPILLKVVNISLPLLPDFFKTLKELF